MMKNLEWMVKEYGAFFEKFGIGKEALENHYEEWQQQSNETAVTVYLWYLFHVLIGETKKQVTNPVDLHRNLHDIYITMLDFQVNVEGRNPNPLIQLIIRNRVQQWQAELPHRFRLQAIALDCCPHCENINGLSFEPETVLRHPHFASEKCSRESGCSCGYIPIAVTEEQ